jgi:hypothetical protein
MIVCHDVAIGAARAAIRNPVGERTPVRQQITLTGHLALHSARRQWRSINALHSGGNVMGIFDTLGDPTRRSGGMSPIMVGLMGLLAYRTLKGKGRLADMLGTNSSTTGSDTTGAGGPLTGGALGGGLKDLLDRFRQSGQGPKAESWVAKGPNQAIAPHELESALGEAARGLE